MPDQMALEFRIITTTFIWFGKNFCYQKHIYSALSSEECPSISKYEIVTTMSSFQNYSHLLHSTDCAEFDNEQ
jgi:hypothetical protein